MGENQDLTESSSEADCEYPLKQKKRKNIMNKPVLVVMAAGMGSRYGGLKQIDRWTKRDTSSWISPFMMQYRPDSEK